jgi:hypothetical protein
MGLASMAFQCGGNGTDNRPEPLRNAARAADAIAKSIGEMTTVKRDMAKQNKITPAEELKLTQALLRLNTADKSLVTRLKSLNSAPDATTQSQLLSMFNEVTAALDDLNNNGVLGVQNADSRARLTTIINSIKASVQIIQAFAHP